MIRNARIVLILTTIVFALTSTGCIGRFAAFNRFLSWNQKVDPDPYTQEAIFLVFTIIPVYETLFLADLIVFNSIEFWSGENPMVSDAEYQKTVQSGDERAVQTVRRAGNLKSMTVEYYRKGKLDRTLVLSRQAGQSEFDGILVKQNGTAEAFRIQSGTDGLVLSRFDPADGPIITVFNGPDLDRLSRQVAEIIGSQTPQVASAH